MIWVVTLREVGRAEVFVGYYFRGGFKIMVIGPARAGFLGPRRITLGAGVEHRKAGC